MSSPAPSHAAPPAPAEGTVFDPADFERHHGPLHNYLRRRIGRPQDLEDLMQEVYLRMLRVRTAQPIQNPLAYIYGIAANVVSEFHLRHYGSKVDYDSDAAVERATALSQAQQGDSAAELTLQVEQALKGLSPNHLAVLLLRRRDGLSIPETAARLGLSEHTVKKYGVEALAQVRASMGE